MKKQLQLDLFFLIFTIFYSCYGSFISLYFSSKGLSGVSFGLVISISSFITLFYTPISGLISDYFGTQKYMFIINLGIPATIYLLIYFINPQIAAFTIIGIAISDVFRRTLYPLADSFCLSFKEVSHPRTRNMAAWECVIFSLVFAIIFHFQGLDKFMLYSGISALLAILFTSFIKPSENNVGHTRINKNDIKVLLKNKTYLLILFFGFFAITPKNLVTEYLGFATQSVNQSIIFYGVILVVLALPEIPGMKVAHYFVKKNQHMKAFLIALICSIIAWIIYYLSDIYSSMPLFIIAGLFNGFYVGIFIITMYQVIKNSVNKLVLATASTLYFAFAYSFGTTVTAPIIGFIKDTLGVQYTYILYFIYSIIAFILLKKLVISYNKNLKNNEVNNNK